MDNITPRDAAETATLSVGARIAAAIGILGTAVPALLAAVGGLDWITAHLPLLLTGLGSLVSGGIASYVAVRRMSIDKIAKGTGLIILAAGLSGCVAIRAASDSDRAAVWAFGWGADSAAALSNVAVTGPSTNDSTGVSFDTANSQQQSAQAFQSLISLGAALAPYLAGKAPAAVAATAETATSDEAPADPAEGYGGTPAADGSGVYGQPTCSRCRAYRTAHPDTEIIDVRVSANLSALHAALKRLGHTGSISLPVAVTADGYTQAAK